MLTAQVWQIASFGCAEGGEREGHDLGLCALLPLDNLPPAYDHSFAVRQRIRDVRASAWRVIADRSPDIWVREVTGGVADLEELEVSRDGAGALSWGDAHHPGAEVLDAEAATLHQAVAVRRRYGWVGQLQDGYRVVCH